MAELIVLRTEKQERFKTIDLKIYEDEEDLSWKAKGLHTYLISRPDGWEVRYSDLINRSEDGEKSVQSAVAELREKGYVRIKQNRGDKGQFAGTEWIVSETPMKDVTDESRREPDYRDTDKRQSRSSENRQRGPNNKVVANSTVNGNKEKLSEDPKSSKQKEEKTEELSDEDLIDLYEDTPDNLMPQSLTEKMAERGLLEND